MSKLFESCALFAFFTFSQFIEVSVLRLFAGVIFVVLVEFAMPESDVVLLISLCLVALKKKKYYSIVRVLEIHNFL